jgi:hypothetical protein
MVCGLPVGRPHGVPSSSYLDAAELDAGPFLRSAASGLTTARPTPPVAAPPRQRLNLDATAQLDAGRFLHRAASW